MCVIFRHPVSISFSASLLATTLSNFSLSLLLLSEPLPQGEVWPKPREQKSEEEFLVLRSNSFKFQVARSSRPAL
jgi:hypothetical protein